MNALRSILFVPGNRSERFQKALNSGADGIFIDLEDAVSQQNKTVARNITVEYFKSNPTSSKIARMLRINSIRTLDGLNDILALNDNQLKPDAIALPKVESASEIEILDSLLSNNPLNYVIMIESALGLERAYDIAKASKNIVALCFGGGDFSSEIGAKLNFLPMLYARSRLVCAAASVGLPVFDVPYLSLNDPDETNLITESQQAKDVGFSCKIAIHPKQISAINSVFTPSDMEISEAKEIIDEFNKNNHNVFELNGKMLDYAIIRKAQATIDRVNLL